MNDRLRFAAFGGGLVVLFGAAFGLGALLGDRTDPAPGHDESHTTQAGETVNTGLQTTQAGYTLTDISAPAEPNHPGALSFRIGGPNEAPVTKFTDLHEKQLHLIVVRSDAAHYRHVHPRLAADGTWSIDWKWDEPGTYRVFADFAPVDGPGELVLSRTVTVAGATAPRPLPAPSRIAEVDGYTLTLDGELSTGGGELRFTVARDGQPVTDLQPYLGAYGHLVALRGSDLAYLHVHPEGEVGSIPAGPQVAFHAQAPSAGTYRLYLDFAHGGSVHTAEFTVEAVESAAAGAGHGHHGGGHQ
ncbi:hypothetical protein [Nocardia pseudobrasiliensis]|uniref:Heavy-metal-associated domain-containing protein n=1 Tax=Nocardia pseudobrasiliensis TaxID=45979 RepID=A0A370I7R0_9NOCA|nr:hypothetical protein [Nocardia pseudobrasiliensis]RDI66763.1 hypothetical protein DFR76_104514 [Nocardia pseudobrasiliensis]